MTVRTKGENDDDSKDDESKDDGNDGEDDSNDGCNGDSSGGGGGVAIKLDLSNKVVFNSEFWRNCEC